MNADIGAVTCRAASAVARRFPNVRVHVEPTALSVRIIGGDPALERVLLNVMINACEGDGQRAASSVEVLTGERDGRVRLEVRTTGPNFRPGSI